MGKILGDRSIQRVFLQLTLPTELESAAIRFEYRADEDYVTGNPPVQLQIAVAKGSGFDTSSMENEEMETPPLEIIGVIHEETISAAFDRKGFSAETDVASSANGNNNNPDNGDPVNNGGGGGGGCFISSGGGGIE